MRAWRVPGAVVGPLGDEGPAAAALWEAGAVGVWWVVPDLLGYFPDGARAPAVDGAWEDAGEGDHVAAYLAGLRPVDAGAVVVAPTHAQVTLRAGQQVVWLDPGMAFGTGHHETTRLALEALGRVDVAGRRVLDVGAGSGVLAIAADRLGAVEAWGVDVDPETLPVARANARANRSRARFVEGAFGDVSLAGPFDVVVANLYAELHVAFLEAYAGLAAAGADLLLTGVLAPREALVRAALVARGARAPGLDLVDERRAGEWCLLHLRRGA